MLDVSRLRLAGPVGTLLQLAMVIAGHFIPAIAQHGFAIGGMIISAIAGFLYSRGDRSSWAQALVGGGVVGGGCALIGIAVSTALGDVPAFILLLGTGSSMVTGCLGAAIGKVATG